MFSSILKIASKIGQFQILTWVIPLALECIDIATGRKETSTWLQRLGFWVQVRAVCGLWLHRWHTKCQMSASSNTVTSCWRNSLNSKAWNPQTFSQFSSFRSCQKMLFHWLNMVYFEPSYVVYPGTHIVLSTHHLFICQKQLVSDGFPCGPVCSFHTAGTVWGNNLLI